MIKEPYSEIKTLIYQGDVDEAIHQLDELVKQPLPHRDQAYYLRGNAWRKKGDWQQALNNYRQAIDLNPQSPAREARAMVMDILNFYNKDMYNQ